MKKFFKKMWRKSAKRMLETMYLNGVEAAHLPELLSKVPTYEHRAMNSAFTRGLEAAQYSVLPKTS